MAGSLLLFLQLQLALPQIHRHAVLRQEFMPDDPSELESEEQARRPQVQDDQRDVAILDAVEEFLTGHLAPPESDRVLATLLFTDLIDSTPQAARLGDRHWRELLVTHDAIVSQELERFRGRSVKSTGDGVLATFDGPARAIRCAFAIRDALAALGLEVRAGLHTGEIELLGDDIAGIAVHTAQRVASLAAAGEVLVSRTVADLLAGSEITFHERGEHELKGVPGSWKLFSVVE